MDLTEIRMWAFAQLRPERFLNQDEMMTAANELVEWVCNGWLPSRHHIQTVSDTLTVKGVNMPQQAS